MNKFVKELYVKLYNGISELSEGDLNTLLVDTFSPNIEALFEPISKKKGINLQTAGVVHATAGSIVLTSSPSGWHIDTNAMVIGRALIEELLEDWGISDRLLVDPSTTKWSLESCRKVFIVAHNFLTYISNTDPDTDHDIVESTMDDTVSVEQPTQPVEEDTALVLEMGSLTHAFHEQVVSSYKQNTSENDAGGLVETPALGITDINVVLKSIVENGLGERGEISFGPGSAARYRMTENTDNFLEVVEKLSLHPNPSQNMMKILQLIEELDIVTKNISVSPDNGYAGAFLIKSVMSSTLSNIDIKLLDQLVELLEYLFPCCLVESGQYNNGLGEVTTGITITGTIFSNLIDDICSCTPNQSAAQLYLLHTLLTNKLAEQRVQGDEPTPGFVEGVSSVSGTEVVELDGAKNLVGWVQVPPVETDVSFSIRKPMALEEYTNRKQQLLKPDENHSNKRKFLAVLGLSIIFIVAFMVGVFFLRAYN